VSGVTGRLFRPIKKSPTPDNFLAVAIIFAVWGWFLLLLDLAPISSRLPALAGLLASLGVGLRLDVGNFPTCLLGPPHLAHGLVIGLGSLGDLPVGLIGMRYEQLGDQLALLLLR